MSQINANFLYYSPFNGNMSNMSNLSDNSDLADFLAGGSFDPEFDYKRKKKELSKDTRINKTKMMDVNSAYREYQEYANSDVYRNVERAKSLLSRDFPVTSKSLKDAMKRSYDLNELECETVLEMLANSKDVDVRMSLFDKVIKIRKK